MRISLALLSVAFMLSIGCGAPEDDAAGDAGSTAAVETPAGDDATTTDEATGDETTTTVSLELPGMT